MPVPDFQSLMLPTLTALSGSSDTSVAEVRQRVATAEGLTPEEVQELLPSGRQPVFTNRVSWAIIHMERSGLVEKVQRGIYRLAANGEQLLAQSPTRIDVQLLRHYPAYVAWRKAPSQKQDSAPTRSDDAVETPEEAHLLHAGCARCVSRCCVEKGAVAETGFRTHTVGRCGEHDQGRVRDHRRIHAVREGLCGQES